MTVPENQNSAIARLDCRIRVAATLLRAAPRSEQSLVAAMAAVAAVAAWPLPDDVHLFVAVPAVLLLAALIRFHTDRHVPRREALAAAGAKPADLTVIQAAGPLGGTVVGTVAGALAALVTGNPQAVVHGLLPLAVGVIAAFVLRPAWIGAPALIAGTAASVVAAVAVALSTSAGPAAALVASARSRAVGTGVSHGAARAAWDHRALPVVAAAIVLVAAQVAVRRLQGRNQG
jgi:hypothetical protein